ncbi:MAG: outer membrane lipoprotein chaperone LolA [Burkholderiales bacterium]|nr:outer membrane lipoprotein chaperone LolA [Burkholderiales bacterium]
MRRFLLILFLAPLSALAEGTDRLKNFVETTRSAKADFTQTVTGNNAKKPQQASGEMQFSRPGKFRWSYDKPYEQLIVGDGDKLWIYDKDLEQVTVKSLDQALGGSPAALLAGSNEIEKSFALQNAGTKDGLEWLEAIPKMPDSTFSTVRMGFDNSGLKVMELNDHFGQQTLIKFSNLQKNPEFAAQTFEFTPPKGADVIGE